MAARITKEVVEAGIVKSTPGAIRVTKEVVEAGIKKTTPGAIRVTKIIFEVGISQNTVLVPDTINNWDDTVNTYLEVVSGDQALADDLNTWDDSLSLLLPGTIDIGDTLSLTDYSVVIRYAVGTFTVQIFDNTANVKGGHNKSTSSLKDGMTESLAIYYEGQDMSLQFSDTLDLDDDAFLTYPWDQTESLNLNDFVSLIMATPLDLSDTLVITDEGAWIFNTETQTISAVDTLFLYDAFHSGINQPGMGDYIDLTDILNLLLATNGIFSDTLSLNDTLLHSLNTLPAWDDTFTLSDDIGTSLSVLATINVGDSFSPTDGFESYSGTGETSYIRRYLNDLWPV